MSALLRRARRLDRRRIDLAIAAVFVVVGEIELAVRFEDGAWLPSAVLAGLAYAALAWRRRHPLAVGVFMLSVWLASDLTGADVQPLQTPLIAVLFIAYAMGAYTDGRSARIAPFVIVVGMVAISASFAEVFTDYVFPTAFALLAWLAGRGVRTRTRLTEELHEAAVRAQEAHEEEAARAAADERRRIAREMHDVVAHSVSVMVVQAGGARRILARDPGGRWRRRRRSRRPAAPRWPRCGGCSACSTTATSGLRSRRCASSRRWSSARGRRACPWS